MKTTAQKGIQAILIIIFSTIIASLFGAIHNQISYSVSSEFFKNFLFGIFGTNEWNIKNERLEASIVGIIGSYWVGVILGIIYTIIFLFMKTENNLNNIKNAILINIGFAFLGSLIAYLIAKFFIKFEDSGVFIDFGTQNPQNYLEAAFMNTGSYFGGVVGIIIGIIYLLKKNQSTEKLKKERRLTLYWQNAGFWEKLDYSTFLSAAAFHIVFFFNLDNLKKHRLRSV